jgi:hypothetical protein
MSRLWPLLIVIIGCCKAPVKLSSREKSNDCLVLIQKDTTYLSGIDAIEEFQKSRFDIDFIIVEQSLGSKAHFSIARFYLDNDKWFYKNSRDFYEVVLNRDDYFYISELSIETTFTNFTCPNPSRSDSHYYMLFSKKGTIQRLESNKPISEVVISDSNNAHAMKTLQMFERLQIMLNSVVKNKQ